MGVLQRFEKRLGGLVEGAFARVFRGGVEPVEIAGALARECDEKRAVGPSRVLVPNVFVIELGPADHERLEPYEEALSAELATMVREHAEAQNYSFVGPVQIGFERGQDVPVATFRVRSSVLAATPQHDEARPKILPTGARTGARLMLASGGQVEEGSPESEGAVQEFLLPAHGEVLVGRADDVDVRLRDTGVSRRHALLRFSDDSWWIEDLGSTNGLVVNGREQGRAELRDGDRIQLASTTLIFRAGPRDGGSQE